MTDKKLPLEGQVLAFVDFDAEPPEEGYTRPSEIADLDQANLITSKLAVQPNYAFENPDAQWHKPVLDIDLPITVLPSSTPGHHHLFIDAGITWDEYIELLELLARLNIIEQGYLFASKERGYTCVRLPWIKKGMGSD